ncbi:unnamed protein product [Didymodactylos carnosus]|uniref:F-box domain-containing protein n=1 Tax=Didymodactylos carnosus TaxID=1234261 RepID=A0A814NRG0_9BILA|nr:unnamed protein product [Didymodactylos carnosus]CAF3859309.1 unnamed protein product [Didymodactylos carnosus]
MASTSSSSSSSSILLSLFELPNPVVINIIQHLTVFDYFRLFGSSISKNQLPSYILNDPLLWSDVDLSQCQLLPYDIYQLFKFYIQQNCSHVQKLAFTLPSTNKVGIDRAECFDFKLFTKLKKIKIFTHDQPYICQDADEDKKTHDENRIEILNNYYLKMICAQCQQLTNIQIYSFDETYNVGELKLECIPQLNSVSFIGYGIYENFQTYDLLKTKLTRLELGRLSMYGIISQIFQSCLLELKSLVYFKCKIDFIDDDDDDDSSVDNLTDFTQFLSKLKYIKEVYIDFYFNVTLPQLSGANKHINLIVFYQKIGEKLYLNSEYYLEENRGEKYVFNRHMLNLKDSKQNVKQYLYKYILCNKYLMTKDELVETTWSDLCWQIQLLKTNVDLQDINGR